MKDLWEKGAWRLKRYRISRTYGAGGPFQFKGYVEAGSPKEAIQKFGDSEPDFHENIANGIRYQATLNETAEHYWNDIETRNIRSGAYKPGKEIKGMEAALKITVHLAPGTERVKQVKEALAFLEAIKGDHPDLFQQAEMVIEEN